jgi:hypothetical protein
VVGYSRILYPENPMTTTPAIRIDPVLASLLSPLTEAEAGLLEYSLATEGCRDPLVVWAEEALLLDGHHRHGICTRIGIPFDIREVSLPNRQAAVEWRLATQLARRNLSPMQASYYRGKLFESLKRPGTRTDRTLSRNGSGLANVSDQLSARYGVPRRTLTRDAAFARSLDALAGTLGVEFRQLVLSRQARLTRQDVMNLAKAPAEQRRLILGRTSPRPVSRRTAEPVRGIATSGEATPAVPTPDLHLAWERAAEDLRAEFLGRPDVLALAARLLEHKKKVTRHAAR